MNLTFSIPAILIFLLLFGFSFFSFYQFVSLLLALSPWKSSEKRKARFPNFPKEEEWDLFFAPWERRIQWYPTIASLSVLLGLLGTVLGISETFGAMSQAGKVTLEVLARGIQDALYTTIFGLLVAIPATFFQKILETKMGKLSESFLRDWVGSTSEG